MLIRDVYQMEPLPPFFSSFGALLLVKKYLFIDTILDGTSSGSLSGVHVLSGLAPKMRRFSSASMRVVVRNLYLSLNSSRKAVDACAWITMLTNIL